MVDATNPQAQTNRDIMEMFFRQNGLSDMWKAALGEIASGLTDPDDILFRLRDTPAYKTRFAANDARVRAGLPELLPGDYIRLENQYKASLSQAGMPPGFYDDPSDFSGFIARNTAPAEVERRVAKAQDAVANMDPNTRRTMQDWYGVDSDHLAAYFLDPERAEPLLERQYRAAQAGGQARNVGLDISQGTAELAGAVAGGADRLGQVAESADTAKTLGQIYGDTVTDDDLVKDALGLDGGAATGKKLKRLASQERAAFGGTSGTSSKSLSQRKTSV